MRQRLGAAGEETQDDDAALKPSGRAAAIGVNERVSERVMDGWFEGAAKLRDLRT
jgi:hypothetical protein